MGELPDPTTSDDRPLIAPAALWMVGSAALTLLGLAAWLTFG